VSCGVPFLYVPLTTRTAVDSAAIDPAAYARLMRAWPDAGSGVFCFSAERAGDGATVYSRMFAPAVGVFEDAATGIASGPLGCYLVRHNVVTAQQAGSMISLQGVRMGRPSQVHISVAVADGDIRGVRVGGMSVLAGEVRCTFRR